jgi:hypothetical protein
MDADRHPQDHLDSGAVAAYLDRTLSPSDRARVEAHALECEQCRRELIEVTRLLRARPHPRQWYLPLGVAAAAALVLFVLWPRPGEEPLGSPGYREPAVTTTVSPVVIAPRGVSDAARSLVWTAVPHADRYRLAVFDGTGQVLWESQTSDTTAPLPDSLRLHTGTSYFWKVEAQTSWNRWVSSELVEFSIDAGRR